MLRVLRRHHPLHGLRPGARRLVAIALVVALAACSDDGSPDTTTSSSTTTTTEQAAGFDALLLTAADLPDGFAATAEVDDTITSFCVGQDAAAGLQASAREAIGFARTPAGASVIQLVFRFEGTGAEDFVRQADALFASCSGIPDVSGLAFEYEGISDTLDAFLASSTDSYAAGYGVSVGSGTFTIDVAVVRSGDVGELVAVLGLDQDRADLDALAAVAFEAAVARIAALS